MTATDTPLSPWRQLLRRRGLRQFVKFCIVGASSTLIDFSVFLLLIEGLHLQRYVAPVVTGLVDPAVATRIAAASLSFLLAVTNGFVWNSRWTFRHSDAGDAGSSRLRYAKFVATNTIGLGLNLTILTLVAHAVPPALVALLAPHLRDPAGLVGKAVATGVVVFWNFTASKYWTFRS